jgi:hypothetical protein
MKSPRTAPALSFPESDLLPFWELVDDHRPVCGSSRRIFVDGSSQVGGPLAVAFRTCVDQLRGKLRGPGSVGTLPGPGFLRNGRLLVR